MSKIKIVLIITGVVILSVSGAGVYFLTQQPKPTSGPFFSFNRDSRPGWWAPTPEETKAELEKHEEIDTEKSEDEATSFLTVTHGGSPLANDGMRKTAPDRCFLMYSYYQKPEVDVTNFYEEYESGKKFYEGDKVILTKNTTQTLQTFEGDFSYEFHEYDAQFANSSGDYLNGYSIGFAKLPSGYVRIEGVCKTAEDLRQLPEIMEAVRLEKP